MKRLTGNRPWKMEWVLKWNVNEMHYWLSEDIERQNLEAQLRKGNNVTQL